MEYGYPFIYRPKPIPQGRLYKIKEMDKIMVNELAFPKHNTHLNAIQYISHVLVTHNIGYKNSTINFIVNDFIKFESRNSSSIVNSKKETDCPIEQYVLWSGKMNDD
jgi:hypothetical protein